MADKTQVTTFRPGEKTEALNALVRATKTNQSICLRELIPSIEVVQAMIERELLFGSSGRGVTTNIALGCVDGLVQMMTTGQIYNIKEQYQTLSRNWMNDVDTYSDIDIYNQTALLFVKWSRAKRSIPGYRFEQISYHDKKIISVAVGPDDEKSAIEMLKKQIVDYAERFLGL